jgi:PAS domain S-box-containing protein
MNYLKTELYELIKRDDSIFDFIQESALDGLWYWDLENREEEWMNPKFWTTLGYDPAEMPHKAAAWQNIINPDDLKIAAINLNKHLEDPLHPYEQICRYQHKNGSIVWIKCAGIAVRDHNGKPIRMIGAHTDISEFKRQEEFLISCNQAALIGYWEVDLVKQKIYWSKTTKEIHEVPLSFEPDLTTAINFFKEGENQDRIVAAFTLCAAEGHAYDLELQIITFNNNHKWIRAVGQATFANGSCRRVYGTFQDITISKEANIALTQEKEKLQSLLQSTNSGSWEWNIQTGETVHNEKWANILGYKLSEISPISSSKWMSLVHPEDLERSNSKMQDCFDRKQEYYNCEYRIKHKNGEWIWVVDQGKIITWTDDNKPLMMFGTHTDITAKKNDAARNLLFIENTPTAIAMLDNNMKYLAASEKWMSDYNIDKTSAIGRSHYELFPEIGEEWKTIHKKCLEGISDKREEESFVRQDGSIQWLKWEIKPWFNDKGKVGGIIMYTEDITSRKKTEEQLRVSEEAFRGNFENAAIGMALLDLDGKWLEVNHSLCTILGYTEDELIKLTFQDITHPEDLEADLHLVQELIEGKRSYYHMEKRYIGKNGHVIYIILAASLVRASSNEPLYFISQIIDITPLKKAESELATSLSKTQSLMDANTQVAIIETDLKGTIVTFNKGAENLLGYTREEIISHYTPSIIHLEEEVKARAILIFEKYGSQVSGFDVFTFIASKAEYDTNEWTYVKKDGTTLPVQLSITAIKTNGVTTGYLGIATDISHIKNVEKEIQSLLHVTQDQNERLKNFAHIVSHNLRSHSGNITMMLDLLNYEQPEMKSNEYIQLLGDASENLKETITHLNEVVVMNTSISDNLQNLNIHEYLQNTIRNIAAIATKAEVTINNQVDPTITIQAVPAYLDSILLNFITNGIKYRSHRDDSFIKIAATIDADYVVVAIEDNGVGIDLKKNLNKLFGMYKTFHGNKDARGIGLFITKNQVEALGGKIEVSSELNKGTTFKIYFKYEKS